MDLKFILSFMLMYWFEWGLVFAAWLHKLSNHDTIVNPKLTKVRIYVK